jgi:HK97 family phage major capsid protein
VEAAPSVLGDISSITRQQHKTALALRREWAAKALREHPNLDDMSESVVRDLARVNSEMDYLLKVGEVKFPNPLAGGMIHPGSSNPVKGSFPTPSGMKAGHWSKPIIDKVEGKALTSGSVTVPALTAGIVTIPDRPISLASVIPSERLQGTNQFSYLQETVRTHAAAEVAAGTTKPVSTYTVAKVDDTVRTIATISEPVNRFDLDDAPLLDQYIQGSLSQAVLLRLDGQILNGNGTPPNLKGMVNATGKQTQVFSTSILQTARKAMSLLYALEIYTGMVFVMSPAHWEACELTQLSTGGYALQNNPQGAPVDLANRRLWGCPVVVTSALSGTNAVLFCPAYTHLWERETVQIDFSEAPIGSQAGVPGFSTNEITFRAEMRVGFGVTKGASVVLWATS